MSAAVPHYEDDVLTLVVGPYLAVAVWRDAPRMAHVAPMRSSNDLLVSRTGGNHFVYVNAIVGGTPRFDNAVRKELAWMISDYADGSLGQASLILIEGLAGTATRAFMSTLNLVSKAKVLSKVFRNRDDTEAWVLERIRSHDPKVNRMDVVDTFDLAGVPH